jgi:TonB family protein
VALPLAQPRRGGAGGGPAAVVSVVFGPTARATAVEPASLVLAVVIAVALFRLARLAAGLGRLSRWQREGQAYAAGESGAEAAALAGGEAELRVCAAVRAPATFGWRRPVVVLPPDFAQRPASQRRDALLHELIHVRRGDWKEGLAAEVAAAGLWFLPAVRWAAAELRLAREQLVDAEVVARTGARRDYAETLLALATPSPVPALAASFNCSLERRIDHLLKEETMSKRTMAAALAACMTVSGGVALAGAHALPLGAGRTGDQAGQKEKTEPPRKAIHMVPPAYPAEAKSKKVHGTVELDVLITAAGEVTDVKVKRGPAELTESAVSAVRQWKYQPGQKDARASISMRFVLEKQER